MFDINFTEQEQFDPGEGKHNTPNTHKLACHFSDRITYDYHFLQTKKISVLAFCCQQKKIRYCTELARLDSPRTALEKNSRSRKQFAGDLLHH